MHRSPGRRKIKPIAIAAAFVALILAWVSWAYIAHLRLQKAIAEISARHEPVYISDLDFSPIPNNRNAAFYYLSAIAAMSNIIVSPSYSNLVYSGYPPFPPAWYQMMGHAMTADQAVFPLVRTARAFEAADWGARPGPPGSSLSSIIPPNYLSPTRQLACLIGDAIEYAHLRSNDAEAIRYTFDLFHLADCVDQRGFLIGELVGVGIKAIAADRIQAIAPDLQVQGDSDARHAAPRAAVMQLINHLLDDKQELRSRKEAMIAERALDFDHAMLVRDKATVLRPMLDLDAVRVLGKSEHLVQAMSQSNYPAAMALDGAAYANSNAIRLSRMGSETVAHPTQLIQIEFRSVAERRVTAVSLAVRLYRADHGQWPASLKILVGQYLPSVPEDPFSATHQPIGYAVLRAPNGSVRPLVYFDPNGVPSVSRPPNSPCIGWVSSSARQWRDLSLWWLPAPATKP
ncbi:MAG TPA: hypothetical protein VHX86_17895 [Tepidisphaeraceae bacterium]|jgi:hypothetical protein|nr:hypothetical protein [Tepidisphaeraceae bacterium]